MHFHARKRLRDQYERLFRIHATSVTRARPHQHRLVQIERYSARELDHDNFVGGCKPLVDALSRAGLIWDDSQKYVTVEYGQRKATARTARTVVAVA